MWGNMSKKKEATLRRLLVPFKYDKKIIAKGDGRRYNGVEMLHAGIFSDSISRSPINYSANELSKIPNNICKKEEYFTLEDDRIFWNTDHEPDKVLSRIGYVPNIYFEDDTLKGDAYLHCLTHASNDVRILIDAGYVNGLSVEILTKDKYIDGEIHATDIVLVGLAVVCNPADSMAMVK